MEICWKKWIYQKRKVICYFTYCETAWEFFFNTITSIKTKLEFEIWHVGFLCIKKKREGGRDKRKTLCTKHSLSLTLPVPTIDDYKIAKLIGP